MIYNTLTQEKFSREFKESETRQDQFSYTALEYLYNYLNDFSDDINEAIEFDMVAICCDYSESTRQEFCDGYNLEDSEVDEHEYIIAQWEDQVLYRNH